MVDLRSSLRVPNDDPKTEANTMTTQRNRLDQVGSQHLEQILPVNAKITEGPSTHVSGVSTYISDHDSESPHQILTFAKLRAILSAHMERAFDVLGYIS